MSKKAHSITVHLDLETRDAVVRMAKEMGLKNSVFVGDVIIGEYLNQAHQQCPKKGDGRSPVLINRSDLKRGLQKSPVIADRAFAWLRDHLMTLV